MAWIWIVVKNTHKCFLINHMEGKLAKHSDFFPIIEFLDLKSLNSNSQQFHVLLLRFEILTVTDRSARQAGWHSITLLLAYYHQTIPITFIASTEILSRMARCVLNCGKSSTTNLGSGISEWYQSWQTVGEEIGIDVITMETQSDSVRMEEKSNKIKYLASNLPSAPSNFYYRT